MLQFKFVEFIPEKIEEGVLYISTTFCTAIHKCVCGCGNEVVTPLSPTDWELTFDGKSVSLYPSIGNWSFECESHYFITKNTIEWSNKWSKEQVVRGRNHSVKSKEEFFENQVVEEAIVHKEIYLKEKCFNLKSISLFFRRFFKKLKGGIIKNGKNQC